MDLQVNVFRDEGDIDIGKDAWSHRLGIPKDQLVPAEPPVFRSGEVNAEGQRLARMKVKLKKA